MPSFRPARLRLPVKPSAEHLRKQAKRRAQAEKLDLAAAQHALARDYGCRGWAELMHVVETMRRGADQLAGVKHGFEPLPKAANANDLEQVRAILASGQFTQHDLDKALARSALRFDERGAIARLLLEHGADPDGQYGSDYGPIVFVTGECLDVEGLQFLIDAGGDVTFPPLDTKYGRQCPLGSWLGTYVRGKNDARHRGIDILLERGAFVPPEVTPPMLAILRGDPWKLSELIAQNRSLLRRTFPDMPYGNILLRGATLLHCAVEFGEIECVDVLLDAYRSQDDVDINTPADILDGIGGQTPIYHAINSNNDGNFTTLEHLVNRVGRYIDMNVRATFRLHGEAQPPLTPLEYAEKAAREIEPKWAHFRPRVAEELALLRKLDRRAALRDAGAHDTIFSLINRGEEEAAIARLQAEPGLRDAVGPIRFTPLHAAARAGAAELVRTLLEMGAAVDGTNPAGNTPLWLACQSDADADKRIAVVRLLLDAGASPRRECEDQSTPLHYAAWRGPREMVELLIRHNAKTWQGDRHGKLPIDYARTGVAPDKDAIVHLLDRPVIDEPHFRAAVNAIHAGDLPALRRLLADHPNLPRDRAIEPDCYLSTDYFGNPKLLWFVANNPTLVKTMPPNIVELAEAIIDAGVEPADLDYTLELVMTSDPARDQGLQLPLMHLLRSRGARVGARAIEMTLGHALREPVLALLDDGLPLTAPAAAGLGRVEDLKRLLPGATPADLHAAFSLAVINGEVDAAHLCLEAGADVNAFLVVHQHSTALHHAAGKNDRPMVDLLLEHGARLDTRDTLWQGTPADWADHAGHEDLAVRLRGAGASRTTELKGPR